MRTDISIAEHWTLLAALRWYRDCGFGHPDKQPPYLRDIATNGGDITHVIGPSALDELANALNGARVIVVGGHHDTGSNQGDECNR